jgi:hypothetical protein
MIRNFTGDNKVKSRITEARAILAWNNVVGDAILSNAVPIRIKTGILYVCVRSASWAQELKGLEPTIIRQINKYLGLEIVREIRFFQGSIKSELSEVNKKGNIELVTGSITVTQEERERINSIIDGIQNDDLKALFIRILEKDVKLQKWRESEKRSL